MSAKIVCGEMAGKVFGPYVAKDMGQASMACAGKTIKCIGYLVADELEWPIPCIQLTDGTLITSSADDEGNGPGVLQIDAKGSNDLITLCEARLKR